MTFVDRAFIKAYDAPGHGTRTALGAPHLAVERAPRAKEPAPEAWPALPGAAHSSELPQQVASLSTFRAAVESEPSVVAAMEVPQFRLSSACEILSRQPGPAWDGFIDILIARQSAGEKCLALTSTHRGEGRTTVCLAAARRLAARGLNALVIDADFENPSLAANCGLTSYTGWGDAWRGGLPIGEALVKSTKDGWTLMPWQGATIRASELATSAATPEWFAALRAHFDVLLVDWAHLALETTSQELAQLSDAVGIDAHYVVRDVRWTLDEPLEETCDRLARAGLHVGGIIENFLPVAAHLGPGERHPRIARRQVSSTASAN